MSGATDMTVRNLVEEELIYGALRREQLWKMIGLGGAGFGVVGCPCGCRCGDPDRDPGTRRSAL